MTDVTFKKQEKIKNKKLELKSSKFKNKVILIVDRINNAFLENSDFLEYVNLTSNSVFMRASDYYNIKNNHHRRKL